ncbi:hypothetical protein BDV96DRAFT_356723 [Lophiotrema nucula]|uniref:Rhodopsin domain-containing protein n=1 Tax=Lophiotrema nucula TaxID=690887 RepID=A0A6A5YFA9_9PLEO|nr:hypothetical protein BDV96DRAFT_356723 [Lophiotrema nucula]
MVDSFRPPPPGVLPNFANPPFMGLPVIITASICLPLVIVFAAIRFYAKAAILKKWKLDDFVFCLACPVGIAMIAFEIAIVHAGPNGYHAWDIPESAMDKSSILHLLIFSIALGPVLWLLKLTLFCLILSAFGSVRWLKNCAYIGIVVTGLFFSAYTIVVTSSCGPRPGTDAQSYLNGLNRKTCSSSNGPNAVFSIMTSVVNFGSDLFLLLLPLPCVRALTLPPKQKLGIWLIMLSGSLMCLCSLLGMVYRIKSWRSYDLTGTQIPLYVLFVLELSMGLIIPCMPSVATVYRHYTIPDIDDTTTLATPNMKLLSSVASPQSVSRATWRKTHLSIEEIPYKRSLSEFTQLPTDHSRMKALPATPLPLNLHSIPPSPQTPTSATPLSPTPKTPKTPNSIRSMRLPIMFQGSSHR